MPQHSQITAPQLLLKMQRREKNSRRLKRRPRVCYFVFSVSPVEALQAMLASPLLKMILLTARQPRPGRGRRGPQGQPVSKLFAKSPGLPGTSSPPQCV